MWKRLPPVMSEPHCRSAILGAHAWAALCAPCATFAARPCNDDASPAEWGYACLHGYRGVLLCPRGREVCLQDSRKTRYCRIIVAKKTALSKGRIDRAKSHRELSLRSLLLSLHGGCVFFSQPYAVAAKTTPCRAERRLYAARGALLRGAWVAQVLHAFATRLRDSS